LLTLADALESGRLTLPVTGFALQRVLGGGVAADLIEALNSLHTGGAGSALRLLAAQLAQAAPKPELVWSGPDASHSLRSTPTVVGELFRTARERVVLAGFAVARGDEVFQTLAQRMDADPTLDVRLFLNVHRRPNATPVETIAWFGDEFRERVWPGKRLPIVFYDPRSVSADKTERAVLHAKCVVVDGREALVTSANFTPHAQERNIELGVRLVDERLAVMIEQQLSGLVARGDLLRLL
jgi:phosphatidylserine/phosphatidylglycerophosphate/cardiolipin synthase-like enzyme